MMRNWPFVNISLLHASIFAHICVALSWQTLLWDIFLWKHATKEHRGQHFFHDFVSREHYNLYTTVWTKKILTLFCKFSWACKCGQIIHTSGSCFFFITIHKCSKSDKNYCTVIWCPVQLASFFPLYIKQVAENKVEKMCGKIDKDLTIC